MYPRSMFLSKNKKNITFFLMKIIIFTAMKNRRILHGRVLGMLIPGHCLHVYFPYLTNSYNYGN